MRRPVIALFTLLVLFILFVVLCTFVRRPYEKVLISRFGSLILEKDQVRIAYNWYFKLPSDTVVRVDTRLHLFPGPLQQVNTAGSQSISIQTYAAWRIVDPVKFYNTTKGGSDAEAQRILGNKLSGLVTNTVSSHGLDELFNTDPAKLKTAEMEATIAREATYGSKTSGSSGMMDLGIEIVQVGFSRMSFPPSNANAVYDRMAQEQNTKAVGSRTEGEAEAQKLVSAGKAAAAELRGQAVVAADQIRGDADKEAARALAAVQQSPAARDFYQYWKSLEFVKTSLAKNTYFVLSTDSPWLKGLFTDPRNGQSQAPDSQPLKSPVSALPQPLPLDIPIPQK